MAMDKVLLFVRVSKGMQDYERQIQDLTGYSKFRNFEIVKVITETGNGTDYNKDRACITELLHIVAQQKVQKVLVSEVSRLGRKTSEVLQVVEMLAEKGVSVFVQNFGIETLNFDGSRNPIAQFLFTMLAEFARLERENLRQRINSGLDEARRKGKRLGRPKGSCKSPKQLLKENPHVIGYLKQGISIRNTAKLAGVSTSKVQKIKKILSQYN